MVYGTKRECSRIPHVHRDGRDCWAHQQSTPCGACLSNHIDAQAAEIERLRKGIKDFLANEYEGPFKYKYRPEHKRECRHGVPYYSSCGFCIERHFTALLNEAKDGE